MGILHGMIVSATELANESKSILDRVVQGGEVVEVQRHGKTVAVIQPRVGATRSESCAFCGGAVSNPLIPRN